MNLLEIKNILKKDIPLHYREDFSCTAVFEDKRSSRTIEIPVDFSLEHNALGNKDVEVTIKDAGSIDYPLLPIKKSIQKYILDMDKERKIR